MLTQEQYEELRKVIMEANTEFTCSDIRLVDILIALGEDEYEGYGLTGAGEVLEATGDGYWVEPTVTYNLHKDSLDAQSPELKEWLYGILVQGDTLSPTSKG